KFVIMTVTRLTGAGPGGTAGAVGAAMRYQTAYLYVSPISHFISQSTQKQVIIDGNPFQNRKPLGIGTVDLPVASRRTDCASLISVAPQHFALTGRRSQ